MKTQHVKGILALLVAFSAFSTAQAQFYPILTHYSAGYPVATGTDSNGATYYLSATAGDYEEIGAISIPYTTYIWTFSEDSTYNGAQYISNNGTTPAFSGVAPLNVNSFTVDGRTIYASQFVGSQCNTGCTDPAGFADLGFAQGATSTGYRMYGFYATTSSANFAIDQATMYSAIGFSIPTSENLDNWGGAPATTTVENNSIFSNDFGDFFVSKQQTGDAGNMLYYWNAETVAGSGSGGLATSTQLKFEDMTLVASTGERYLNLIYETVGYSVGNSYACPSSVKDLGGNVLGSNIETSPNTAFHAQYASTFNSETHRFYVCIYDMGTPPNVSEGLKFNGTIPSYRQNTNTFRVYGVFTSPSIITSTSYTTIYTFQAYINTKIQNITYPTKYFTPTYPTTATNASTTAELVDECFSKLYEGLLSSATYYNLGVGLMCATDKVFTNMIKGMFVPKDGEVTAILTTTREQLKRKWPIGYVTRSLEIWNSTATSSLPAVTVSIPFGANEYEHLTFDMDDMFNGANNLLEDIRDPIYNKSLRDVAEPMVQLLIAIAVLYTLIADMTGLGLASADNDGGSVGRGRKGKARMTKEAGKPNVSYIAVIKT